MNGELMFRCENVDAGALIERALAAGFPGAEPPTEVEVDDKPRVPSGPWTDVVRTCANLRLNWGKWGEHASLDWSQKWNRITLRREGFEFTPESVLALIRAWPFEACFTDPVHPWPDSGYHALHGWAFALKGAGHRLCSARVRDRGPWRILRDAEHDVTMFQFHDLDAPADVALEQARPGHALLRSAWFGGHYVGDPLLFRTSMEGLYKPSFYDPGSRTSIVLVQDREVSAEEMGVAAATRVHQIYAEPVAQVAFVYIDEATARRQLPALWLHGLEVRAMTAQGERRIDLDYEPPPLPELPAWVERLGTAPRTP
jgi:hypothetical protein